MFRNSAVVVFVLYLSAPLFSQDQTIRVTRSNDLIVVDTVNAPLDQILAEIEKKLGIQVRRMGNLGERVTTRIVSMTPSELFNRLLSNRASFFLKTSALSGGVDYVVVMGKATDPSSGQRPSGPLVVTIDGTSASGPSDSIEARMAKDLATAHQLQLRISGESVLNKIRSPFSSWIVIWIGTGVKRVCEGGFVDLQVWRSSFTG